MSSVRVRLSRAPNAEAGVAMVVVLLTLTVVAIVSATLVALAMNEYQIAGGGQTSRQAILLSEAAVELGIYRLQLDGDWGDSAGATQNVTADGGWFPLFDGAGDVTDQDFPGVNPLGQVTVELCRASAVGCPGAVNSAGVPGCSASGCIWIQATGKVGASSRRIHILLSKSFPQEVPNFSNSAINIGAGGGGNGVFRLHGSLYVAGCTDPDGNGPQPCIGLQMQGNAAILNDVPFPIPGDTPDLPPYNNRVYVRGWVTGQGNSWLIGSAGQPMRGFHAFGWASTVDDQIFAVDKNKDVPMITFPDPSKKCEASDPTLCLITRIYHPTSPLPIANAMTAYVCTNAGGCTAAQWQAVNLNNTNDIVPFCATGCNNPWGGGNIRTKVVIPDRLAGGAPAVNCTLNAASASTCNSAGFNNVNGANDFTVVFNGFGPLAGTPPGSVLNLAIQRTTPTQDIYLHSRQPLRFEGNIYYNTVATVLVENASLWSAARPPVHIRGSLTPECRASQGSACTQTFGQPMEISGVPFGNTLGFAVGPACSTNPASVFSCTPPSGGGIYVEGSNLEIDLVLLAHGTIKNDNPHSWYGLFIANLLDWDNNPQIFPVEGLKANLPPGIFDFIQGGSGVSVVRWREVF